MRVWIESTVFASCSFTIYSCRQKWQLVLNKIQKHTNKANEQMKCIVIITCLQPFCNNSIQYLTAVCDGYILDIVNIKVPARMERSGWKMATMTTKGEFRSATATSGARFATSHGHPLKHLLSASSLVSSQMVSDLIL